MKSIAIIASTGRCKTRVDGTLVLELFVEPNDANDAFSLFGAPGLSVALARIKTVPEEPPIVGRTGFSFYQCALQLCKDTRFHTWMYINKYIPVLSSDLNDDGKNEEASKMAIYLLCKIRSRSELDTNELAANIFDSEIRLPFMEWRAHSDLVQAGLHEENI